MGISKQMQMEELHLVSTEEYDEDAGFDVIDDDADFEEKCEDAAIEKSIEDDEEKNNE
jgi:hypothetical protein